MAKELNFTLEGVQGDLKLKYGPLINVYTKTEERSRNKDDSIRNIM